ncbi:MAG TPA: glycoside hydrolase family 32 protein [Fimbriimonas sp.]|nr:glycoside hydrolase family 32 protein [Fimbriimonas sp.]
MPNNSELVTASSDFFYRPEGAWAADFIPFFKDGVFHLFYLLDWRDWQHHGEGVPWYHISTRDFVDFTENGEALPRGTAAEQDLYVFTGSVVEGEGMYHIFYTGHNPHLADKGKPMQGVLHATSPDLITWTKQAGEALFAPSDRYEPNDWRDPFVYKDPESGRYHMILAARLKEGPPRRRGCTALCSSTDLQHWKVEEPLWTPGMYITHECPDLFHMGDWWYLVFSEYSERTVTRYRMSRTPHGPWICPPNDTFDGRGWYAAKTASDGHKRYAFGWGATKDSEKDSGGWQWGGNLVVHELIQNHDGTLDVRNPESVDRAFRNPQSIPGDSLDATGRFACKVVGPMPRRSKIETTVTFDEATRGCGLFLNASDDMERVYYVKLDTAMNRLVFESYPRLSDATHWPELERPLKLTHGKPIELKVILDGTLCVIYAGGRAALTTRLYDHREGAWGWFASEGKVQFERTAVSTL